VLVVFSDIEMGAGGLIDDFVHDVWLADLIRAYNAAPYDRVAVDLVFNGDTLDLLKTPLEDGSFPRHISSEIALAKTERIIAAHPAFFDGLRDFVTHEGAPRRIHFLVGNHDFELLFTTPQKAIRKQIGADARLYFPGFRLQIGNCHIEHGMQQDPMFVMDEKQPMVQHKGRPILNLPWGNVALLDVAMPMHQYVFQLDRTKPRNMVFEMVPEVRDLLVNAYWSYWTQEYVRDWVWGGDPIRKMSWKMFRELVYRFGTHDTTLLQSTYFEQRMRENSEINTFLVGHHHQPSWHSFGDRKVLHTGCMRDEFMVGRDGHIHNSIPKVYAEVFMSDDRVTRSHLVEVRGPASADDYMPETVYEVAERVRPLLQTAETAEETRARMLQEKKEGIR
jgi:hypothetical protein